MNLIPETPNCGAFALVSYIPDPLGSFLEGLQQFLPAQVQPHITILPPRPLKLPVEAASKSARKILREFPPFYVKLSRVCYFPGTNFLYLDVAEGNTLLRKLHQALNTGDLVYPEHLEFRPHLTLGGPVGLERLPAFQQQIETAWRSAWQPRRFRLSEIVGIWVSPTAPQGEWHRLWSHHLRIRTATAITLPEPGVKTQRY